jgi:acetate kinase
MSASKQIAAMGTVLDGIDLLVFTGGIGEHDCEARGSICDALSWTGIRLDAARNAGHGDFIDSGDARTRVRVLPSQEEQQIAHHAWQLVGTAHG